jgi:hypothetical protein
LIHGGWSWPALVGGAILLPALVARRTAALGLGMLALALAALRVGGGPGRLPGDFAAVELSLMLLGIVVLAWAALAAVRQGWRGRAATLLLAAGLAPLLADIRALAHAAPSGAAAALTVTAGIVALAWLAVGLVLRRVPPVAVSEERVAPRWIAGAAAGALLAAGGPHLGAIFGGVILTGVAVAAEAGRRGRFSAALAGAVPLVTLAVAGWLFATIAGDQGLAVAGLSELPLSPAAEALLAPLLLLAAWSVAGLWPMGRSPLSGLAGPAGLFLVARVVLPALPEGLDHWRPLAYPILAIGLWQAIVAHRWSAALVGAALFALAAGSTEGVAAAWWLGTAALAAGAAELCSRRAAAWLGRAAALAGGIGALPGTTAALEREVVYTTLAIAGAAILLAADRGPGAAR